MQTDPALLQFIVQGGSFGLIVAIVVYAIRYAVPSALAEMKDEREKFLAALDRRDARQDSWQDRQVAAMAALTAEVKELADRTAEHRALLDDCPHRHQLPTHAPKG